MNQPRKHHYLPQFYLRGFSLDQDSIHQIEKETGACHGLRIKDTAAIRDFHEIDGDSVADPQALEKFLATLEGDLAVFLRKFLKNGVSDNQSLAEVKGLLSLLRMRVPAVKSHIEKSHSSAIRAVAKEMERTGQFPPPPQGFENVLSVDNMIITTMNWKCLELMLKMASNQKTLDIYHQMHATLYRSPPGFPFITSDQPVALFHPRIKPTDFHGVGPAFREIEITLPLSSEFLILLDHKNEPDKDQLATPREVYEYNRRTIIMAQNYIFTNNPTTDLLNMVAKYSHQRAGFIFKDVYFGHQFFQFQKCSPVSPDHLSCRL